MWDQSYISYGPGTEAVRMLQIWGLSIGVEGLGKRVDNENQMPTPLWYTSSVPTTTPSDSPQTSVFPC